MLYLNNEHICILLFAFVFLVYVVCKWWKRQICSCCFSSLCCIKIMNIFVSSCSCLFAIKPCYLENHASQMKSCWGTLSGSNGCSIRIRPENSPEAPPSGEIILTSYPVGNETSLSRKPCIPDEKLLKNAIRKQWSLYQNPSWKIALSAPGGEITMTSYPAFNKTSLSRNPCIPDKKLLWNTIRSHGRTFRIRH